MTATDPKSAGLRNVEDRVDDIATEITHFFRLGRDDQDCAIGMTGVFIIDPFRISLLHCYRPYYPITGLCARAGCKPTPRRSVRLQSPSTMTELSEHHPEECQTQKRQCASVMQAGGIRNYRRDHQSGGFPILPSPVYAAYHAQRLWSGTNLVMGRQPVRVP